jgi:lysophospholipase L1-like esterase
MVGASPGSIAEPVRPSLAMRIAGWTVILLLPLVSLGLAELVIRWDGRCKVYSERNGLPYVSMYQDESEPYRRRRANDSSTQAQLEFTQALVTNSLGFRDVDWPREKPANELRVLVLGDSFIEGMGADRDNTMPAHLRDILAAHVPDRRIVVMNGGIAGSDPVHNLNALTRVFLELKPDIVVQSINVSDVADIAVRGGLHRYDRDGRRSANAPAIEPLFRASHLVRAIVTKWFGYNNLLLDRNTMQRRERAAVATICEVIEREAALASKHDFHLAVVAHPSGSELTGARNPFAEIEACLASNAEYVDLFREMVPVAAAGPHRYAWPVDQHFKPAGYRLFAELVARKLLARFRLAAD